MEPTGLKDYTHKRPKAMCLINFMLQPSPLDFKNCQHSTMWKFCFEFENFENHKTESEKERALHILPV
jgi:hypothetical protein